MVDVFASTIRQGRDRVKMFPSSGGLVLLQDALKTYYHMFKSQNLHEVKWTEGIVVITAPALPGFESKLE